MALSYNCPIAQLASDDWPAFGWSSYLKSSEIAVVLEEKGATL